MSDEAKQEKSPSQIACDNAMGIIGDDRVIMFLGVRQGDKTSWTMHQRDYPLNAETIRDMMLALAHNARTMAGFNKRETVAAIDATLTEALEGIPDATPVGK